MRAVPGFRRVVVAQSDAVGMTDHRRALRAARPVLAGAVVSGRERRTVGLRSRQHVMPVRGIAAAVDDVALLAQRGLFGQVVGAVQLGDIPGDHDAFGILPGSLADAVARIHGWLTIDSLGREIGAPGFYPERVGAGRLRQGLTVIVGAGETAEVAAIADASRGQEETGVGRLRLGPPSRENREGRRDRDEARACEIAGESGHIVPPVFLIRRRVAAPAWSDTNTFLAILFRFRDIQTKTARPDKMKRRRGLNRGALHRDDRFADDQVCWIAESSQLAPRGRMKVHTSVTSSGSPPETSRPVVRSKVLSTSAYRIATLA